MIARTWTLAAIAAGLLCFSPLVARADAASDARLAAMEQRMSQLEDKLAASEAKVEEQAELLKTQATPPVGAGSEASKLDAFFDTVSIGGYVSASFIYNNNNPDNPLYAQAVNQFDLNHNTFNLDAAKLEIGRVAAAPGEAGFQIDLMFGDDGGILGAYGFNSLSGNFADNFVYVQEMYASYNWSDVVFKFGKWETLLGSEVIDPILNRNVTHGLLFTYAIPLVHTGLIASGKVTEEVGWAAAFTNGWNNATDTNDNKGVLAQVTFAQGSFSTALTGYYGADGNTGFAGQSVDSFNTDHATVIDWTATVVATDALQFWWNVDWGMQQDVVFNNGPQVVGRIQNAQWYGAALGTQYTFDEKTTIALRGEAFRDSDGYRMFPGQDTMAYSLTGTLGYKLTPNLITRLEVRMDEYNTDDFNDDVFPQGGGFADGDFYGILNVAYVFD